MTNQLSSVHTRLLYKQISVSNTAISLNALNLFNYSTKTIIYNIANREDVKVLDLVFNKPTTDYINSFRDYVVSDASVVNGTVSYCFNEFDNANIYSANIPKKYTSGVKDHYAECIEKDWFSIQKLIPNHIISDWRTIEVKHQVEVAVAPGQSYAAIMNVEMAAVKVPYNAILYLQAKDNNNNEIVDSHLEDLAKAIFGNNVVMNQLDQTTVQLSLNGLIIHEFVKDVYIEIVNN